MAHHWDSALKGSSSLRAALCRALKDEIACCQRPYAATVYFDLSKFFVTIDIGGLAHLAQKLRLC